MLPPRAGQSVKTRQGSQCSWAGSVLPGGIGSTSATAPRASCPESIVYGYKAKDSELGGPVFWFQALL